MIMCGCDDCKMACHTLLVIACNSASVTMACWMWNCHLVGNSLLSSMMKVAMVGREEVLASTIFIIDKAYSFI